MHKTTVGLLLTFLCFLGSSLPKDSWRAAQERRVRRYVNCDYGYVVKVPLGLVAHVPEYQNHGFYLDLPDRQSRIEVYNAYNMSDSDSPPVVFDYELNLQAEGRKGWKVLSRHNEQVQGRQAIDVTTTYSDKGTAWEARYVIVYRPPGLERLGDIIYLFELTTPVARYEKTSAELDRVIAGFAVTRLPLGPCSNN